MFLFRNRRKRTILKSLPEQVVGGFSLDLLLLTASTVCLATLDLPPHQCLNRLVVIAYTHTYLPHVQYYTCTYVRMHMHTQVCTPHTHTRTHARTHTHTHTHVRIYVHTHTCTYVHSVDICMYVHTRSHVYGWFHNRIHILFIFCWFAYCVYLYQYICGFACSMCTTYGMRH